MSLHRVLQLRKQLIGQGEYESKLFVKTKEIQDQLIESFKPADSIYDSDVEKLMQRSLVAVFRDFYDTLTGEILSTEKVKGGQIASSIA